MKIKANVPQIRGKIRQYVYDNIKEYALVTILFIIGIFVGVIVVNNLDDVKTQEINIYIIKSVHTREINILKRLIERTIVI